MFLLADSQLLYSRGDGRSFLSRLGDALPGRGRGASAAYLGASNGDAPVFFELFAHAVARLGIERCVHVRADGAGSATLDEADLVALAGGDVELGWLAFESGGVVERVRA